MRIPRSGEYPIGDSRAGCADGVVNGKRAGLREQRERPIGKDTH
jgi:hypothetical protein